MSKIFLSDIHIGDRHSGLADVFPFLEQQDDIEEVILLGDIFDFWVASLDVKENAEQLAGLLAWLDTRYDEITWVIGNHDADIWALSPICSVHWCVIEDHTIALHGHQFDMTDYTVLKEGGYALAKLINWVNGHFKADLRKWLSSVSQKTLRVRERRITEIYAGADVALDFKYVVVGHTHNPGIIRMDSGKYILDCGDWREHRTAIKETAGGFQLLSFEEGQIKILGEIFKSTTPRLKPGA